MHMADALLSPGMGGVMWAATAATTIYSARKVQNQLDNRKIPLMGVLGAFVFAAQMINFSIPGTGSSGHLGGGLLLAIFLGPHAAFLTLASVLTIQALFFADGGLLALGCNIFNLGFFPCFIAYPLIYKNIVKDRPDSKLLTIGSILAAIIGIQLGSFGVVLQTYLSGIAALPLFSFLVMMQPIHLAIGLVEGLATAGVASFIWNARPEIIECVIPEKPLSRKPFKNIIIGFLLSFAFSAGFLSWHASKNPDGLEWAIEEITGTRELESPQEGIHAQLETIQDKTSFLPGYRFKTSAVPNQEDKIQMSTKTGTSLSGLLGGTLVLFCGVFIGFFLKKKKKPV
jgi:cobalt/nickel transport system permease protein